MEHGYAPAMLLAPSNPLRLSLSSRRLHRLNEKAKPACPLRGIFYNRLTVLVVFCPQIR